MPVEPRVRCLSCDRVWNTAAMAEGLALIGSCPRCGGTLEFREPAAAPAQAPDDAPVAPVAPHRVLGLPRL